MKKILLALGASLGVISGAQASLVLSNSFAYPGQPGDLTVLSAGSPLGVWTVHSGSGAVTLSDGRANLSGALGQDVNTAITNSSFPKPFTNEILYASFTVNFSTLPAFSGTYFAHFKDDTTGNFRCRVFARANSAWGAGYRLGIQNGSATGAGEGPLFAGKTLDLNTDYKVVIRFKGSTNSTIWINPGCEGSVADRADATDVAVNAWKGSSTFALRQANDLGVLAFDDLLIGTTFTDVTGLSSAPPGISGPANQYLSANTDTGPLTVLVDDCETPAANLDVTGTSDNPALVPNLPAHITFGGSGANRTVTITPVAGQQGTATIQLTVKDGDNNTTSTSFVVNVGAPRISTIPDQETLTNTPTALIPFTVWDAETPNNLVVTGVSSNPGLVQDSDIHISTGGTNRTVQITPQPQQNGLTTITLTVTDPGSGLTDSWYFKLAVYRHLGVLFTDAFSYDPGYLPLVSLGLWQRHSGTSNDFMVVDGGRVLVSCTNADDVFAPITLEGMAFTPAGADVLYSKFDVNFAVAPRGSGGDYFAHFKDDGTFNFHGRIFAGTNGAAPGKYRIGIANGSANGAVYIPQDLALGTTYTVVSRYNVGLATSKVWVNPHSEASPSATATDRVSATDVTTYAFRQDGPNANPNSGVTTVDNLVVGTAFTDVATPVAPPSPIPLNVTLSSGNAVLTWANPLFNLQSAPSLNGPWTTLWDAATGYSVPATGTEQYFRLYFYP